MSDTIREQILSAIEDRLPIIRIENGFQTDCGKNVFRVRRNLGESQLPAVIIWPRIEETIRDYGAKSVTMPVEIQSIMEFGDLNPSIISERMLGDLIEAMLARAWILSFTSGGSYQPRPGQTIVGAASGATAFIESISIDSGSWSGGSAAGDLTIRRKSGSFESENINIGSNSNVATINGSLTYNAPETLVSDDLASDIVFNPNREIVSFGMVSNHLINFVRCYSGRRR